MSRWFDNTHPDPAGHPEGKRKGRNRDPVMPAGSDERQEERVLTETFRLLPKLKCPDGVTEEILRLTIRQKRSVKRFSFVVGLADWRLRAAAAVAVAALIAVLIFYPGKPEPVISVSPQVAEVDAERASEQLKWSLMYTSQLLNKSEKQAIGEAVINKLPETFRNTLKKTIPLFQGGES